MPHSILRRRSVGTDGYKPHDLTGDGEGRIEEMTILYSLIGNHSWEEATLRCSSHPKEASQWHHLLPIHRACELDPPVKIIRSLIKAFPDGVKSEDDNRRLPLHFACWKKANLEVVEALLQAHKEGSQARDVHGRLALHVACEFGASEDVVKALVRAFPASIYVTDLFQRTPVKITSNSKVPHKEHILNILQGRRTSLFTNVEAPLLGAPDSAETDDHHSGTSQRGRSVGKNARSRSSSRSRSRDSLTRERSVSFAPVHTLYNLIAEKNWEDATICAFRDPSDASMFYTENGLNMLPIHKACELQPTKGIVRVLIEAHKDGLAKRDQDGRLPLHSACWKCASEEVVAFLVKVNKDSARVKDFHGRLPLHLACEYGASEQSVLTLIKAYPEGVNTQDDRRRTPLEVVEENQFYNKDALIEILSTTESNGHIQLNPSGLRDYLSEFVSPSISRTNSRASSRGSRGSYSTRSPSRGMRSVSSRTTSKSRRDNSSSNESLYTLVSHKQWGRVEGRCQIRPEEASKWLEKRRDDGSLSWRLLPLHRSCELQPTVSAVKCIIRAYPEGLKSKDHSGRVPLHSACRKSASAEVIATLATTDPRTAAYQDKKGRLPLHIACEYGASREVIEALVCAFPKGVDQTDLKGYTPRKIVERSRLHHKGVMLAAFECRKPMDETKSAFYNEDEDASLAEHFQSSKKVLRRPPPEILKNLSVSFANSEVDDENQHMLKPTMGYDSKHKQKANNNQTVDQAIWISNTTSSLSMDNDEGEERTILCSLVTSAKWEEAIARCQSHPEEAGMWWCKRDRSGHALWQLLPIHKACELAPTPEIVNALVRAYPECVSLPDQSGRLPVHLACCRGASPSVISILLEHGGEASLTVKDSSGRLPLHVACVHGAAERVVNMLINAYSEGVEMEDNNGRTPIKIVQQSTHRHKRQLMYLLNKQSKRGSESRSVSPSRSVGSIVSKKSVCSVDRHSTCSMTSNHSKQSRYTTRSANTSLIPAMELKLSLELKDSQSTELTATDTTASTGSTESAKPPKLYTLVEKRRWELVDAKIHKYRSDAKIWYVKKKEGKVLLRELTLHRACQLQAPVNIIKNLVSVYSPAAKSKTHQGKLPMHLACEFGCTHQVVDALFIANPESVHQRDDSGMLPIHYACDKGCSVDVIKMLIRKFPASLDEEDN
eukprot:CAMPEP_0116051454 /NCGR_PEP_ID=MMETSP0322-20121206/990_1 /TAXON_ID=163516 /ORGANISM="Leptocylindrus danicus var. apora, Strain B651" /LENGTH=1174 /DNA_ID=CAMNT_0003534207 /DNA_START=109 /DNA_END=3631 /DNA_ORIENTATION=-